jgi:O-antigen/teichoic acid export membrane protein
LPRNRNRRVAFASSVGLVQRVAQLLAALVTLPLIIRDLGVAGFGVWGVATSLVWLSGILDFGLGSALVNSLPETLAGRQPDIARNHFAAALAGSCALSLLIAAVGIPLVAHFSRAAEIAPLMVAVVGLAVNVPLSIAANAWFGLQRGHIAATWDLFQTALMLLLLILATVMHAGVVMMVTVVYAAFVSANAGSLLHLILSHPELRPRQWTVVPASIRHIFRQGGIFFSITVAVSCSYLFDNFIALHWLGAESSARITVALRLCTTVSGIVAVLTQPLWPAFVESTAVGDRDWTRRSMLLGTGAVMASTVACGVFLVCYGDQVLRWWLRRDIGIDQNLLMATGAWIVALGVPRVSALLLNAIRALRFQLIVASAATIAAFALKYGLVGRYGAAGILGATPIAWLAVAWPAYAWKISRGLAQ